MYPYLALDQNFDKKEINITVNEELHNTNQLVVPLGFPDGLGRELAKHAAVGAGMPASPLLVRSPFVSHGRPLFSALLTLLRNKPQGFLSHKFYRPIHSNHMAELSSFGSETAPGDH